MQKMMKGMASGSMPNMPGMPNMAGMSGRAARKLAQQAGGRLGSGWGPALAATATSTCSPSSWATPASCAGRPRAARPGGRPARSSGRPRAAKKKKKGGRVTPPKGR